MPRSVPVVHVVPGALVGFTNGSDLDAAAGQTPSYTLVPAGANINHRAFPFAISTVPGSRPWASAA